ncbi:hypothetical protein [Nonomuraea sp. NPDC003201]
MDTTTCWPVRRRRRLSSLVRLVAVGFQGVWWWVTAKEPLPAAVIAALLYGPAMRQGTKESTSNGRCSMATMKREVSVAGNGRMIFMVNVLRVVSGSARTVVLRVLVGLDVLRC